MSSNVHTEFSLKEYLLFCLIFLLSLAPINNTKNAVYNVYPLCIAHVKVVGSDDESMYSQQSTQGSRVAIPHIIVSNGQMNAESDLNIAQMGDSYRVLAHSSSNISNPVINENVKYIFKIEPHLNGPAFMEIHFLTNTTKKNGAIKEECKGSVYMNKPYGIRYYLVSDSHYFSSARYCCFNLPRFARNLHSLIKDCREYQKFVLT
uniref:Uncharacterized protein n=1 Tax=Glossina pallidipes TaxID=7398 RepID=A0A1A9ZMG9_GLOPL